MLSAALLLVCQSMFWHLHLAGEGGSFPKPLTAEEEKKYLERCTQGDLDARNVLVERNLRLVAHIIKKMWPKMPIGRKPSGEFVAYIFRKNCATKCGTTAVRQSESGQL